MGGGGLGVDLGIEGDNGDRGKITSLCVYSLISFNSYMLPDSQCPNQDAEYFHHASRSQEPVLTSCSCRYDERKLRG